MPFPIKVCAVGEEEFALKPDKPGFANRCPECSTPEGAEARGEDAHGCSGAEGGGRGEQGEAGGDSGFALS